MVKEGRSTGRSTSVLEGPLALEVFLLGEDPLAVLFDLRFEEVSSFGGGISPGAFRSAPTSSGSASEAGSGEEASVSLPGFSRPEDSLFGGLLLGNSLPKDSASEDSVSEGEPVGVEELWLSYMSVESFSRLTEERDLSMALGEVSLWEEDMSRRESVERKSAIAGRG